MTSTPKTIQIFLPGGDPRGIRIAEITTRIVQVIEVPETNWPEMPSKSKGSSSRLTPSRASACAFSTESMNGRRTCRGRAENCARIELPKVSAVMPVPSETKNTVRSGMLREMWVR